MTTNCSNNCPGCKLPSDPYDPCCPGTTGSYTTSDITNAFAFAYAQINKIKSEDPNLIKKYCENGNNCFQWKTHSENQTWPISHLNSPDKLKNYDSTKPYPWENWYEWASAGHIHIVDAQTCNKASQLPYTCSESGCKMRDAKDLASPYLEWRTSMCDISDNTGISCTPIGECSNDRNCSGINNICKNGKCTCSPDSGCHGNSECVKDPTSNDWFCESKNTGGCFVGNFILKQWCENPQSRCAPLNDSTPPSYPAECKGSDSSPGVTDVPPFYYNSDIGSCFMTPDYCGRFLVDADKKTTKTCNSDNDCTSDPLLGSNFKCVPQSGGKKCIGPLTQCENPGSDPSKAAWWAENFTVGKTLFRLFKSGKACNKEEFKQTVLKKLNILPEKLEKLVDSKLIDKKTLLVKNFIPEIDLYMITWNKQTNLTPVNEVSVDSSQIRKKYPQLLKIKNNKEYLVITKEDIKQDNNLKRLFSIIGMKKDLMEILEMYIQDKKK